MFYSKMAAFFLFVSVLGSAAVFAQTPQLPQQQQKVEVNDSELSKFAKAFQGIRMIGMEAQQEMTKVVEKEGMDVARFNEIQQANLNPEVEVTASEEEIKKQEEIVSRLKSIQQVYQEKMEEVISEQGLTAQRYEQISMGLQADPELQEKD
jgi:uncharacterized membrane protein YhiD involved in acid resistance